MNLPPEQWLRQYARSALVIFFAVLATAVIFALAPLLLSDDPVAPGARDKDPGVPIPLSPGPAAPPETPAKADTPGATGVPEKPGVPEPPDLPETPPPETPPPKPAPPEPQTSEAQTSPVVEGPPPTPALPKTVPTIRPKAVPPEKARKKARPDPEPEKRPQTRAATRSDPVSPPRAEASRTTGDQSTAPSDSRAQTPGSASTPAPGAGGENQKETYGLADLDKTPRTIRRERPPYPRMARRRGIEGWVKIKFLVDRFGRVRRPAVLSSQPEGVFDRAVLDTVPRWSFAPGKKNGRAVDTWVVTTVRFKLK